MAVICMFFPAVIMCFTRKKFRGDSDKNIRNRIGQYIAEYAGCCMILNFLLYLLLIVFFHNSENIYYKLNQFGDFAIKYLALSVTVAVAGPYIEHYIKENVTVSFDIGEETLSFFNKCRKAMVIIFVICMFLLHFIRIFDNSFWGDEGIAINAAHMTWMGMLEDVALNGHTPFHYALVWIICKIFGYSGTIYHFVSVIPYMLILAVTLTYVWKWFGTVPVIILAVLSAFLENAVFYNLEVRMYSWCQLFIFLAYLTAYQLMRTRKGKYYIYLMLSALGAVYCHYFALASMGILYLSILIYLAKTHMKDIGKLVGSGCLLITGFLPWIIFCYRTKGQVMTDYHMEEVSWRNCFEFIFASKYSAFLFMAFITVLFITLLKDLGAVDVLKTDSRKVRILFNFKTDKYSITPEFAWIVSGVCAVFGMIAASKAISTLVFPIIVLRYLYPSFIIIWLLMGICISKCPLKEWTTAALVILIIISCFPYYHNTVKTERINDKRLERTLEATNEINGDDYITTDINHFNWTVSQVYYPDTGRRLFSGMELPEFNHDLNNWLFLSQPISDGIIESLKEENYTAKTIVENGYIGTGSVWIYKLVEESE